MKVQSSLRALALAVVVLVAAAGSATADDWFILGSKTLSSANASAEVDAEKGKWFKEDIKKTKITVEGGDVEVSKVVLRWNNRPDDTIENVGVIKSGGETAPKDAPGREATLTGAAVHYKILNNGTSATLKLWGYD